MQGGPQTVNEAAMQVLRSRNAALRNMPPTPTPSAPKPQVPAQNATTVLNKISQNNLPKTQIAQHQQAQLAQRAVYAQHQRQQQAAAYGRPPQQAQRLPNGQQVPNGQMMMVNGQPVPMPPGYNMSGQQHQAYARPQPYYPNNRPPARSRRR